MNDTCPVVSIYIFGARLPSADKFLTHDTPTLPQHPNPHLIAGASAKVAFLAAEIILLMASDIIKNPLGSQTLVARA